MRAARPTPAFLCFLACLCCALWLTAAAPSALADPEPYKAPDQVYVEPSIEPELRECPELPEALDSAGEQYSDELIELREARADAVRTCRALADRQDLIGQRLWWAVVELAEGRDQRTLVNERLSELLEQGCEGPCPVTIQADDLSEAQTAELVESIDAGAEASKVGLWTLVGAIVGIFVAYALLKLANRGL